VLGLILANGLSWLELQSTGEVIASIRTVLAGPELMPVDSSLEMETVLGKRVDKDRAATLRAPCHRLGAVWSEDGESLKPAEWVPAYVDALRSAKAADVAGNRNTFDQWLWLETADGEAEFLIGRHEVAIRNGADFDPVAVFEQWRKARANRYRAGGKPGRLIERRTKREILAAEAN
jgi:hypothetical protein